MKPRNNKLPILGVIRRGVFSAKSPLLAQMVVTRYCNLDCGYCNEFDKVSKPVAVEALLRRVDALARLDTAIVTCTGGEPLTHPELPQVIARVRAHGMIATMISNAFLMTREWIERLNDAGLQEIQISIDNVEPDDISKKSLRSARGKLELLREHAKFAVNVNSVLGISDAHTDDAIEVSKTAVAMGFTNSVALLHDGSGQLKPFNEKQWAAYHAIGKVSGSLQHKFNYRLFQRNLLSGRPNDWKCRAGARYLYICENGVVHRCSQQRRYPGIAVENYTVDDIRREFETPKGCAPTCTLSCVHQASVFDQWRPMQPLRAAE